MRAERKHDAFGVGLRLPDSARLSESSGAAGLVLFCMDVLFLSRFVPAVLPAVTGAPLVSRIQSCKKCRQREGCRFPRFRPNSPLRTLLFMSVVGARVRIYGLEYGPWIKPRVREKAARSGSSGHGVFAS